MRTSSLRSIASLDEEVAPLDTVQPTGSVRGDDETCWKRLKYVFEPLVPSIDDEKAPVEIIGRSAYCFFLIPNPTAKVIGAIVVYAQICLFVILWNDGPEVDKDVGYEVTNMAKAFGVMYLVLGTFSQISAGLQLIALAITNTRCCTCCRRVNSNHHGFASALVGAVILLVVAACISLGMLYSLNSQTNTRMITSLTVALFVEKLDEQMYAFFSVWNPRWNKVKMKGSRYDIVRADEEVSLTPEDIQTLKGIAASERRRISSAQTGMSFGGDRPVKL